MLTLSRKINDLVNLIKQISLDAVDSSKPIDLKYGTVTSTSPLRIQVDLKLVLGAVHLIVPRELTNYSVNVEIAGSDTPVVIKNALKINDKVALLRETGGKQYYVLGRV